MVLPLDELTKEQKCAAFGIGVDFSGIVQNQEQMELLDDHMDDFRRNLGLRRSEIEEFMQKMESGGRLSYAINALKTNQNNDNDDGDQDFSLHGVHSTSVCL